ncbi:D-2-hydroxyglutarate dehydrogenase YdiJ [Larsenimonas suaedae]|uniref:FAD-binding and (Fe-S)-binding domain-containing protein n=1 Tax=Larsenimonas suaedae TaxID=1851019 RepID=A0ABU1GYZ7_9GAMM|nr:FAD-binding and (Fe-S)-binding domain-containing protein [Larsenimonas suaedae]MCM2971411.1 FAD-binding oxidoreductase [Larsenimonas suaedae]MDR5896667.1 FAD-binding and (Fe-S)-binding domain-containing protein [Larsenimonas suaedae]
MTHSQEPSIPHQDLYLAFLSELDHRGFEGDIASSDADRTVLATDNSIYERVPQAALFPRHAKDVALIARLAGEARFKAVTLTPRGGGTGTNGQSLTDGLVVDVSRYMNRIIDIDPDTRRVVVEPGVVKDQLNATLKPHGLFFAPELSTSNRATLGGMINTDASGQGSCEYGKTRDHVLGLKTVLIGGETLETTALTDEALETVSASQTRSGALHRTVSALFDDNEQAILDGFPPLNRCLTGYDLPHLRNDKRQLDLNSVLCGSEGSLGILVEATLNVLPIPAHSALVNVRYEGFMDALRDATSLMAHAPTSIETVDEKVLLLAMDDYVWEGVADFFPANPANATGQVPSTRGINLVEFNADTEQALEDRITAFLDALTADTATPRLGHTIARGRASIQRVYAMRKRAVGLLGNARGERRPLPFVEDTAVPPERLADYIQEFRDLLDGYGLQYGMFGHVDAGVLHVRPALDMRDPAQAALIRPISDQVAELTQRYGGLLWGEHGKGIRSAYTPDFFGELYPLLQRIKGAFDPDNQLNPGKIATPLESTDTLLEVDGVTFRGELDRPIDEQVWRHYSSAVYCNGNGACFNYDPNDAMCPSWKATRDRRHSPKGRAMLFKEWLRREDAAGRDVLAEAGTARTLSPWMALSRRLRAQVSNATSRAGDTSFDHEVFDAMAGCLSCKSCAGQCPIKVDVPDFKSQFLSIYAQRHGRVLKDYLVGYLEAMLPLAAKAAPVYNTLITSTPGQKLFKRLGLVDTPTIDRAPLDKVFAQWGVPQATPITLARLSPAQRARSVILVQDAFTRYFDSHVVRDTVTLLQKLDLNVLVAPFRPNGKPSQVMGQLGRFEATARINASHLNALADVGVPLVGVDPAMTLTYRQEYVKALGPDAVPDVLLLQEWLQTLAPRFKRLNLDAPTFKLLSHCTERTTAAGSASGWQAVFKAFGVPLELVPTGCCGMSGTYGHETAHKATSEAIYDLSWRPLVETDAPGQLLATGYSCRSQVKRFSNTTLEHPVQALLKLVARAEVHTDASMGQSIASDA